MVNHIFRDYYNASAKDVLCSVTVESEVSENNIKQPQVTDGIKPQLRTVDLNLLTVFDAVMQEQNITEYDQLSAKAEDAVSRFHALTEQLRRTEADLSATSELMGAVVRYAKTRPVFDGYKAAKYSRKYLTEHEADLADYRAAKATMGELLGGEKLPKMAELKEKRRQLAARKKALYADYRTAQEQMRQAVAVKTNIDHLLGVTDGRKNKEQER